MSESIEWLPWSADAFQRAAAENKPVLLNLSARWCGLVHLMEQTTWADEEIAKLVNEQTIPVAVDADDRPDLNERYNLGGWPTTAFLTELGVLIAGATYIEAAQMKQMMTQLSVTYSSRREEIDEAVAARDAKIAEAEKYWQYAERTRLNHEVMRKSARGIVATFDGTNGGFGREPKFPFPGSMALANRAFYDTGGPDFQEVLVRTFQAVGDRGLFDAEEGGFFRYCTSANWTGAQTEKLTEDNAALAMAFIDAWLLTGMENFRDRAVRTMAFLKTTLLDAETGSFGLGQYADGEFHATPVADRGARPEVDRRVFPVPNAVAGSCFLRASFALQNPDYRKIGLDAIDRIEVKRELLRDRGYAARALLDAFDATGHPTWREKAAHQLDQLVRHHRSKGDWLHDRRFQKDDFGELKKERKVINDNAVAADGMLRLYRHTGEDRWRVEAEKVLTAFPDFMDDYGHYTVEFALAMDRAVRPPVEILLTLPEDADGSHPVAGTALAPYVPRRVVRWEKGESSAVRVRMGEEEYGPVLLPDQIADLLLDLPR